MSTPLSVLRVGSGPPLVLVHGGLSRELAWEGQQELAARWRLLIPARRGFPGSPPARGQDFKLDAADLAALLPSSGAHVVGFSYGTLGAALAAGEHPDQVRSLTLIEPPLFALSREHAEVREFEATAKRALRHAGDHDEPAWRAFAAAAGLDAARLAGEEIERVKRLARYLRWPGDARPDCEAILAARMPVLVVSGGHHPALEIGCDAIAVKLRGDRAVIRGAGHAVQRAPGFNAWLESFLRGAESRPRQAVPATGGASLGRYARSDPS